MPANAQTIWWGLVLAVVSCENRGSLATGVDRPAGKVAEATQDYVPSGSPTMRVGVSDRKAAEVIEEYVSKSRSWSRDEYRIEEKGHEGSVVLYWIVHVDDERSPTPGGGKSFAVHYDPQRQEVAKEWAFQ